MEVESLYAGPNGSSNTDAEIEIDLYDELSAFASRPLGDSESQVERIVVQPVSEEVIARPAATTQPAPPEDELSISVSGPLDIPLPKSSPPLEVPGDHDPFEDLIEPFDAVVAEIVCAACGAKSSGDDLLCIACGSFFGDVAGEVPSGPACPECGAGITQGEIFCPGCGAVLAE